MSVKADILICLPCHQYYEFDTLRAYMKLEVYMANAGFTVARRLAKGSSIPEARQLGVNEAKRVGAKWLLFIDADMVFHPHDLETLIRQGKDIIGGLYFGKQHRGKTGMQCQK